MSTQWPLSGTVHTLCSKRAVGSGRWTVVAMATIGCTYTKHGCHGDRRVTALGGDRPRPRHKVRLREGPKGAAGAPVGLRQGGAAQIRWRWPLCGTRHQQRHKRHPRLNRLWYHMYQVFFGRTFELGTLALVLASDRPHPKQLPRPLQAQWTPCSQYFIGNSTTSSAQQL